MVDRTFRSKLLTANFLIIIWIIPSLWQNKFVCVSVCISLSLSLPNTHTHTHSFKQYSYTHTHTHISRHTHILMNMTYTHYYSNSCVVDTHINDWFIITCGKEYMEEKKGMLQIRACDHISKLLFPNHLLCGEARMRLNNTLL